jgi:hypothetical protein
MDVSTRKCFAFYCAVSMLVSLATLIGRASVASDFWCQDISCAFGCTEFWVWCPVDNSTALEYSDTIAKEGCAENIISDHVDTQHLEITDQTTYLLGCFPDCPHRGTWWTTGAVDPDVPITWGPFPGSFTTRCIVPE